MPQEEPSGTINAELLMEFQHFIQPNLILKLLKLQICI